MSGGTVAGRIWRERILGSRVPLATAASTNGCSLTDSTTERTSRTTRGISGKAMAATTMPTLALESETKAMASRIAGIAISPSIRRITTLSTVLLKPASRPIRSPMAMAMLATARPTTREMRAPYTVRAHTSRPSWSVPSQLNCEGGRSRFTGLAAMGSPAIRGAASAASATTASTMTPPTRVGLRRAKCHTPLRRDIGAISAVATVMSVADPGIEQGVGQVDQQIDDHINPGEQQDDALNDGVIPFGNGIDHQSADARQVEDRLRNHNPTDQQGDADAHHRHNRHAGAFQSVLEQHWAGGHALGPRGTHIVLGQDIEHGRARDARDQGHIRQAKGEGGQDQMARPGPQPLREGRVALHGKPAQGDGEHINQQIADHEDRHGEADDGQDHDKTIE